MCRARCWISRFGTDRLFMLLPTHFNEMPVNSMVAQLSTLANEVTGVSLEVGTEGILGGQAFVPDVQGMWKVRLSF